VSKRFVSRPGNSDEEDAQLRKAISAILDLVLDTIESGEDPHTVALPEQIVAKGRSAVSAGTSVQHIRRAVREGLKVLQAATLEEIDLVPCSDAVRADLRNQTVEIQNVLLERLLVAVLAE
jgi:hypothetical protein